jgi:hypothetical protein
VYICVLQDVPYKTQTEDQTSVNTERSTYETTVPSHKHFQPLPSRSAQVRSLSSVLLADSWEAILYSTLFSSQEAICVLDNLRLQTKHGFTWVDSLVFSTAEYGMLKSHIHCIKIICICQTGFQSAKCWERIVGHFFFEKVGGGLFSAFAIISHFCDLFIVVKTKPKIQSAFGSTAIRYIRYTYINEMRVPVLQHHNYHQGYCI